MNRPNWNGAAGERLDFEGLAILEAGPVGRVKDCRKKKQGGYDFEVDTPNLSTGKMEKRFRETKTTRRREQHPRLSRVQKETQARHGDRYRVDRVDLPPMYEHLYEEFGGIFDTKFPRQVAIQDKPLARKKGLLITEVPFFLEHKPGGQTRCPKALSR